MFATLVAKLIAGIAAFGVKAGGAVAPYVWMLTPAIVMVASGVVLYFHNRSDRIDLALMAAFAVAGSIVAAQVANARS